MAGAASVCKKPPKKKKRFYDTLTYNTAEEEMPTITTLTSRHINYILIISYGGVVFIFFRVKGGFNLGYREGRRAKR